MAACCSKLRGNISTEKKVLTGAICSGDKALAGTIPGTLEFHYSDAASEYEGPYEVTPKVEAQTLETAGKIMQSNVEIHKIPYFEVDNTSGGSTVYIAKDLAEI